MPSVTFTVKMPKKINLDIVIQEVMRTHRTQVVKDLDGYFNRITGDWSAKTRPMLKHTISRIQGTVTTTVYPQGLIYKFVTGGTRRHIIVPKRAKFLRFMWGGFGSYVPKTRPGGQYGGPGQVVNGTMQHRKRVNHPGNAARRFEYEIAKDYQPKFEKLMQDAIKRGIAAAQRGAR